MLDTSYYEKTDQIIAQYSCEEKSLIPIIQGIQEEYRYLPPELLTYVAGKLGRMLHPRLELQKQRLTV